MGVVFEKGSRLTTIEESAFSDCHSLAKIILPEGLKSIGHRVFIECWRLKHIQLPNGLEKIGAECFEYSHLEEIIRPASVKEVGAMAF